MTNNVSENSSPTIASEISEKLITAIVNGDIPLGSKLSEPKLAEYYNVSRGPLREAIRRLEGLRLVRHVPREGVKVITLELKEVVEVYQVREALEGMAAGLAARNMTTDEIEDLHKLLEMHERYIKDNGQYFRQEGDFDFHNKIIKGSKNQLLIDQLCNELYHLVRMFRYKTRQAKTRTDIALSEHKQLVIAIEQRDEQLAEMLMRRHIMRARQNIEAKMQTF